MIKHEPQLGRSAAIKGLTARMLTRCVVDHSLDPPERHPCWVRIGSGYGKMGGGSGTTPSIELWAHQVTTPEGAESRVRLQLVDHRSGVKMAADMRPCWAHYMAVEKVE